MTKQVAVLGDATNYGGRIITASGNGYCGMDGVALLGDWFPVLSVEAQAEL